MSQSKIALDDFITITDTSNDLIIDQNQKLRLLNKYRDWKRGSKTTYSSRGTNFDPRAHIRSRGKTSFKSRDKTSIKHERAIFILDFSEDMQQYPEYKKTLLTLFSILRELGLCTVIFGYGKIGEEYNYFKINAPNNIIMTKKLSPKNIKELASVDFCGEINHNIILGNITDYRKRYTNLDYLIIVSNKTDSLDEINKIPFLRDHTQITYTLTTDDKMEQKDKELKKVGFKKSEIIQTEPKKLPETLIDRFLSK